MTGNYGGARSSIVAHPRDMASSPPPLPEARPMGMVQNLQYRPYDIVFLPSLRDQ